MALTEEQKKIIDKYLNKTKHTVRNKELFNKKGEYCDGNTIYNLATRIRNKDSLCLTLQKDVICYIIQKFGLSLNLYDVLDAKSARQKKYNQNGDHPAPATSTSARPNQAASANRMPPHNGRVHKPSRWGADRRSGTNREPLDGFSAKVVVRFSETLARNRGDEINFANSLAVTSRGVTRPSLSTKESIMASIDSAINPLRTSQKV